MLMLVLVMSVLSCFCSVQPDLISSVSLHSTVAVDTSDTATQSSSQLATVTANELPVSVTPSPALSPPTVASDSEIALTVSTAHSDTSMCEPTSPASNQIDSAGTDTVLSTPVISSLDVHPVVDSVPISEDAAVSTTVQESATGTPAVHVPVLPSSVLADDVPVSATVADSSSTQTVAAANDTDMDLAGKANISESSVETSNTTDLPASNDSLPAIGNGSNKSMDDASQSHSTPPKESVFIRLNNRIKSLDSRLDANVTLIQHYLDELSARCVLLFISTIVLHCVCSL